MKVVITLSIFLLAINSFACDCSPIDKNKVKLIHLEADYVIIGTVVDNISFNKYRKTYFDTNESSSNVKVKVNSVLKGKVKSKYVIVNQIFQGNCTRSFIFGNKYLIIGYRIEKFINKETSSITHYKNKKNDSLNQIPITERISENTDKENRYFENKVYLNNAKEYTDYWNKLLNEFTIISTNSCVSFYKKSKAAKLFKRNKRFATKN